MVRKSNNYPAFAATTVWLSLAIRLFSDIVASYAAGSRPLFGFIKFVTAFTTFTNILIGAVLTAAAAGSRSRLSRLLLRPSVAACTATYITVMACVWKIAMAPSLAEGFQLLATSLDAHKVAGVLLHGINPALFLVYWLCFSAKHGLQWKHAFYWPAGALVYFVLILIRGAINGVYPYPFVNVGILGHVRVMMNASIVLIVFVAVGLAFISIGRLFPLDAAVVPDRSARNR